MADPNDYSRIHKAVVEQKSADELRAVIEECALGHGSRAFKKNIEARRRAAVNHAVEVPRAPNAPENAPIRTETALDAARRQYRGDLICVLVENGADVKKTFGQGATAIGVCIVCGSDAQAEPSVRALLKQHDADERVVYYPDCYGFRPHIIYPSKPRTLTAAHLCIVPPLGHVVGTPLAPRLNCLQLLARDGANIDALDSDGLDPLSRVFQAHSNHETALATLLRLGAKGGQAAALRWIRLSHRWSDFPLVACLRALVAAGVRLSGGVFDGDGDTPLIIAARRGLVQVVEFLVEEAGADARERNSKTGALPLTSCAPSEPIVSALLAAGADPNAPDRFGRRPLLHCLGKGANTPPYAARAKPAAMLLLLSAGASLAVRGPHGEPPLLMACERWPAENLSDTRIHLLELLLRRTSDADRRAKLPDGRSAVDLLAEDGWLGEGELGDFDVSLEEIEGLPEDFDVEDDEQYEAVVDAALERTFEAHRKMVAELRIAGASVLEENDTAVRKVVASHALPILARRGQRLHAELAARKSEARRWRAHDCLVQLAFDYRDKHEADLALAATRARVVELEAKVEEEEGEKASTGAGGGGGDGMEEEKSG